MDLKFVVLIAISLLLLILLMNEISSLKNDLLYKLRDTDEHIHKIGEDVKISAKRCEESLSVKYREYTNELIQQFRTMNAIEQQPIVSVSDYDKFVESDDNNEVHPKTREIPYLSETNVCVRDTKLSQNNSSTSEKSEDTNGDKSQAKNDEQSSQEITFGSKKSKQTIDDGKLKKISGYTKQDIINLAEQHNIPTTTMLGGKSKNLNKKELYDKIAQKVKVEA